MSDPLLTIRLDDNGRVYRPGETLTGQYRLDGIDAGQIKAVEVSVLWHTEGKGDEDLAVHDFRRTPGENGGRIHLPGSGHFNTTLPNSPLTYDGLIVKIRWCVRVRVFLSQGKDLLAEKSFSLGHLRAAEAVTP